MGEKPVELDAQAASEAEIELVCDGDGLAVFGDPKSVDRFFASAGMTPSERRLPSLQTSLSAGAGAAQSASTALEHSGRWVKLTKESAAKVKELGLTDVKGQPGVKHAMLGKPGDIKGWIQIAKGPGAALTNPAMLAGAAGIMAQLAMKQTMDDVLDYLATIDEKLDDVLRAQQDAVLSQMIGTGLTIDEAMMLRERRGRVDEVTWSKLHSAPATVAATQAYALRQLDAIAEKLEGKTKISDLATASQKAESRVQEWLGVLARCFQLQEAIAILELDRVLDAAPDELDGHRLGLREARSARLGLISSCTERLMSRIDAAASRANTKVLTHPLQAPAIVASRNSVSESIAGFQQVLEIDAAHEAHEARRWSTAARDKGDRALTTGTEGVDAARRAGGKAAAGAKLVTGKVSKRARRNGGADPGPG